MSFPQGREGCRCLRPAALGSWRLALGGQWYLVPSHGVGDLQIASSPPLWLGVALAHGVGASGAIVPWRLSALAPARGDYKVIRRVFGW